MALAFTPLLESVLPLAAFTFGIFLYAVFVFKFFRFVARRELFKRDLVEFKSYSSTGRRIWGTFMGIIQAIVLYPLVIFFWFLILAILLVFFSDGQTLAHILLVSMAIVSVVRMLSYYDEELAAQISQLLPLALLSVLLLQVKDASLLQNAASLNALPMMGETLVYYFCFIILVEALLHGLYALASQEE